MDEPLQLINVTVKVKDLGHLAQLAAEKKSIILFGGPWLRGWSGHQGYIPAAWALNWAGSVIHRLLPSMYVYQRKHPLKPQPESKEDE